jgi:hypothetical protein
MNLPKEQARLRFFWTWHRRFGIVVAVLVLVLSLTGLALNHTDSLRLDERFATAGWLLDWYGMEAPEKTTSHVAGDRRVTLLGDRLYLDSHVMSGHFSRLAGAVPSGPLLVVAADDKVLILTGDGQLIDRLGTESGVPPDFDALGLTADGSLVLQAKGSLYSTSVNELEWSRRGENGADVRWSVPVPLPSGELKALRADFRSRMLSMERVLLDIHSGRIVGSWGIFLMDAAAVLLLLLAVTGSWLWFKRRG